MLLKLGNMWEITILTDFTGHIFEFLKTFYTFLFRVKNSTSILIFIKIGNYLRNNGF